VSDAELAAFLGIDDCDPEKVGRYIEAMPPEKRATYERMSEVCIELQLWQDGLGPKPDGVIVCREHKVAAGRLRMPGRG
jgi:hypothetical protein